MQNVFNVNTFNTNGAGIFNLSAGREGLQMKVKAQSEKAH